MDIAQIIAENQVASKGMYDERTQQLKNEEIAQADILSASMEATLKQNEIDLQKANLNTKVDTAIVDKLGGQGNLEAAYMTTSKLFNQLTKEEQEAMQAQEEYQSKRGQDKSFMDYVRSAFGGHTDEERAYIKYNNEVYDVNQVQQRIQKVATGQSQAIAAMQNMVALDEDIINANQELNTRQKLLSDDVAKIDYVSNKAKLSSVFNANLFNLSKDELNSNLTYAQQLFNAQTQIDQRNLLALQRKQTLATKYGQLAAANEKALSSSAVRIKTDLENLEEFAEGVIDKYPEFRSVSNQIMDLVNRKSLLSTELLDENIPAEVRAQKQADLAKLSQEELALRDNYANTKTVLETNIANAQLKKLNKDIQGQNKLLASYNVIGKSFGWNELNSYSELAPMLNDSPELYSMLRRVDPADPGSAVSGATFADYAKNYKEADKATNGGFSKLDDPTIRKLNTAYREFEASLGSAETASSLGLTSQQAMKQAPVFADTAIYVAGYNALSDRADNTGFNKLFKMSAEDFKALANASPMAEKLSTYLTAAGQPASFNNLAEFFYKEANTLFSERAKGKGVTEVQKIAPQIASELSTELSKIITHIYVSKASKYADKVGSVELKPYFTDRAISISNPTARSSYDFSKPNDVMKAMLNNSPGFLEQLLSGGGRFGAWYDENTLNKEE